MKHKIRRIYFTTPTKKDTKRLKVGSHYTLFNLHECRIRQTNQVRNFFRGPVQIRVLGVEMQLPTQLYAIISNNHNNFIKLYFVFTWLCYHTIYIMQTRINHITSANIRINSIKTRGRLPYLAPASPHRNTEHPRTKENKQNRTDQEQPANRGLTCFQRTSSACLTHTAHIRQPVC